MESVIWAVPGFLGLPTDWNLLHIKNVIGVDLHAFSWTSLSDWAIQFNQKVKKQHKIPTIVMGYSLGGRLALHALLEQPQQWKAAIIISAHAGLADSHEHEKRRQHDQIWAARFAKEEWSSLMQAWNAQSIFAQDHFHFDRQEKDYTRQQLVDCLLHGSLGKQTDLRQQIEDLSFPILWITGSQDRVYCQIAQTLRFKHPHSCWKKVEQAGHRVPWSQPQNSSYLIQDFLNKI